MRYKLLQIRDVTRSKYVRVKSLCIEHAAALRANNTRVRCKVKACLFIIDKLKSGSSLEGKAFLKNPQNSEL